MIASAFSRLSGGELYYISPNNNQWLHPDDADRAEALGLNDHLLEDFHVRAGGAVAASETMFAVNASWHEGMVNLETNDGHHEMTRALAEATDLNAFFSQVRLVPVRRRVCLSPPRPLLR